MKYPLCGAARRADGPSACLSFSTVQRYGLLRGGVFARVSQSADFVTNGFFHTEGHGESAGKEGRKAVWERAPKTSAEKIPALRGEKYFRPRTKIFFSAEVSGASPQCFSRPGAQEDRKGLRGRRRSPAARGFGSKCFNFETIDYTGENGAFRFALTLQPSSLAKTEISNIAMENNAASKEARGFYKLSWLQRIGFGSGDLAQNLVYQTICMYLLFFYTDIYGLDAGDAALMFLIVRLIDVLWDPLVGTFVDKHNPRLGKYRAYLVLAGVPLTGLAVLCFWNGFGGSGYTVRLAYAYVTYVGLSMLYTLINVPYGALNSSLTRDTDEITILTSTRMFMANVGGLAVSAGIPILVAVMAGIAELPTEMALFMGLGSLPSFIFMPLVPAIKRRVGKKNMFYIFLSVAIVGMAMLYAISKAGNMRENMAWIYVAQFVKSSGVIVATGYMWALIPEVISFGEHTTGKRISGIVNALTGIFFKAGMALGGVVPGFVLAYTGYRAAEEEASTLPKDADAWLLTMLIYAAVGLALFVFCFSQCKERVVMDARETGNVRVSDLWREFGRNKPLRVIAFFFVTAFAMMSVGNAAGAYYMNDLESQSPLAQEGILWLVCVIPAMLLALAMLIISRYDLSDEDIDRINLEIEERGRTTNT